MYGQKSLPGGYKVIYWALAYIRLKRGIKLKWHWEKESITALCPIYVCWPACADFFQLLWTFSFLYISRSTIGRRLYFIPGFFFSWLCHGSTSKYSIHVPLFLQPGKCHTTWLLTSFSTSFLHLQILFSNIFFCLRRQKETEPINEYCLSVSLFQHLYGYCVLEKCKLSLGSVNFC